MSFNNKVLITKSSRLKYIECLQSSIIAMLDTKAQLTAMI